MTEKSHDQQRAVRAIRIAAAATVVGLAGIAGAISYSHMRYLAEQHGEHGWRAHAFPLSVDGIEMSPRWSCSTTDAPAPTPAHCRGPR